MKFQSTHFFFIYQKADLFYRKRKRDLSKICLPNRFLFISSVIFSAGSEEIALFFLQRWNFKSQLHARLLKGRLTNLLLVKFRLFFGTLQFFFSFSNRRLRCPRRCARIFSMHRTLFCLQRP